MLHLAVQPGQTHASRTWGLVPCRIQLRVLANYARTKESAGWATMGDGKLEMGKAEKRVPS